MEYTNYGFLKSAFELDGKFMGTPKVVEWLEEQNIRIHVKIEKIKFEKLKSWKITDSNIKHDSGKFFSIDGIHVKTKSTTVNEWDQPIINQPEIGYLGFIVKEFDGILYFLTQAKVEPGNVNYVQLSPTLQATKSNFTQVHNGKKPLYLEYFQNAKDCEILLDQLQSEQGARFYKKRNRNIIIKIDNEIPVFENFIWLTLGQIKKMMHFDNLVNMDTRTVISGIPFGSFEPIVVDFFNFLSNDKKSNRIQKAFLKSTLTSTGSLHTIESIIGFLTNLKSNYELEVHQKPILTLQNWTFSDSEVYHVDRKYFKIIAIDVEIGNREVIKWSQPMIEPAQMGLCAFVCKEINGILHFAVQAKLECGNFDIIEFAPTVQCLTGNYRHTKKGELPFLEYVLKAEPDNIVYDIIQSEEGGRFFQEQNRNIIVFAGDEIPIELPQDFIWVTLNQLNSFLMYNNYLNIQARSLIAAISFV